MDNLGSKAQLAQAGVIVGPTALRPMEFAILRGDGLVIDAGKAVVHIAMVVKLPVFVAVGAEPVADVVAPFVGKAHSDAVAFVRPQLFDQPVVQFARPLAFEEGLYLRAPNRELGAVAPDRVRRIGLCYALWVTRVPGVLGEADFLRRSLACEWGQRRAGLGGGGYGEILCVHRRVGVAAGSSSTALPRVPARRPHGPGRRELR